MVVEWLYYYCTFVDTISACFNASISYVDSVIVPSFPGSVLAIKGFGRSRMIVSMIPTPESAYSTSIRSLM